LIVRFPGGMPGLKTACIRYSSPPWRRRAIHCSASSGAAQRGTSPKTAVTADPSADGKKRPDFATGVAHPSLSHRARQYSPSFSSGREQTPVECLPTWVLWDHRVCRRSQPHLNCWDKPEPARVLRVSCLAPEPPLRRPPASRLPQRINAASHDTQPRDDPLSVIATFSPQKTGDGPVARE